VDLPMQEFTDCGIETDGVLAVANIQFGLHSDTRINPSHSARNDQISLDGFDLPDCFCLFGPIEDQFQQVWLSNQLCDFAEHC
jgi:hypothetical protein